MQNHHHDHPHEHHDKHDAHNHETHSHEADSHDAHAHKPHAHAVLMWPLLLTTGFALVEVAGGWLTGSLALLGDAGHMLSDAAALGLAWFASWVARKPASQRHTFGLLRVEVIVALLNGLFMLLVIAAIVYEAIQRLQQPQAVHGLEVMGVALVGLIVNVLVASQLHGHQHNINHRAALLHVLGDLLGSVAALAAGAVIYFTGWMPIDPILSILISVLILVSTIRLLKEALHVLLEGVPLHLDIAKIQQAMQHVAGVERIHHIHVWALSSDKVALSGHVVLHNMQDWPQVLIALKHELHHEFDIEHITLQPELAHFEPEASNTSCFLTAKI
jgi:cobalt-zinc-cadmium efflux system protein